MPLNALIESNLLRVPELRKSQGPTVYLTLQYMEIYRDSNCFSILAIKVYESFTYTVLQNQKAVSKL
jgi:hypothetical protein